MKRGKNRGYGAECAASCGHVPAGQNMKYKTLVIKNTCMGGGAARILFLGW